MAKSKLTHAEELAFWRARVKEPFEVLYDGRINCLFDHPTLGAIPFTADPEDPEKHGRLIYEALAEELFDDQG